MTSTVLSQSPSVIEYSLPQPMITFESTDRELITDMGDEALLRGIDFQWGRIGNTQEFWAEFMCNKATFYEILTAGKKQRRVMEQQAKRHARIIAAREQVMGGAGQ